MTLGMVRRVKKLALKTKIVILIYFTDTRDENIHLEWLL